MDSNSMRTDVHNSPTETLNPNLKNQLKFNQRKKLSHFQNLDGVSIMKVKKKENKRKKVGFSTHLCGWGGIQTAIELKEVIAAKNIN